MNVATNQTTHSVHARAGGRADAPGFLKRLGRVVAVLVAALVLFVAYARIFGFNPGPTRPGMWLTGELVTEPVTDWTFAEKLRGTAIETHQSFLPWLAHSV